MRVGVAVFLYSFICIVVFMLLQASRPRAALQYSSDG
jgi:hypothetical protein